MILGFSSSWTELAKNGWIRRMSALRSRINTAIKLLIPYGAARDYAREIVRSDLFDRHFYRGTNPRMHPLCWLFPERHFALKGEALGLRPNPDFCPRAYLRCNPDLTNKVQQPFKHYIRFGRHEQRVTKEMPSPHQTDPVPLPILRPLSRKRRFAIVVHLYYHDIWDEFVNAINLSGVDADIYVTYVRFTNASCDLPNRVRHEFPDAVIHPVPNHGRDVFPFVHLVNSGTLAGYDAVCKIHSKKSPHRDDGDAWRQHLVEGILSAKTKPRLQRFLDDPEAAFWVADGQIFTGTDWWGSNAGRAAELLARLELPMDAQKLKFPAGSIYWLKPMMIDMIRGMRLRAHDFEPEQAQVDGTSAHAMERALGYLAQTADRRSVHSTELDQGRKITPRHAPHYVSAFYLPQFHPVAENDAWWGKGFTEWTNVARAEPAFVGHGQPVLPGELGHYDLRLPEVMAEQNALRQRAGVDAFCVYHYWFDGRRILEAPIDRLCATDVEFPFYLCWANESWRRNWDGLSGEVLLDQSYTAGFARALAQNVAPYMRDHRYQRPDGTRPRFVIYRPDDMPDPAGAVAEMRETWRSLGIGEVELGAVRFHLEVDAPLADELFDFWIEMPPHGVVRPQDYRVGGSTGNDSSIRLTPGFKGLIYDYAGLAATANDPDYIATLPTNTIAGIMPGWDNTARRGLAAHIAHGATPAGFARWLDRIVRYRIPKSYRRELFVNAWNEWAECAMLEPTERYADANIRALAAIRSCGVDRQ
ncbi:MAG: glycoside hydrolase family 99-like domain-containing protein [Celeribacter sp.]|jgi:lipopolysaccharide biosynthesis protein